MYTSTQYVHVAKTDDSTTRRARDRLALILRRLLKAKAHRRGYEVSTQTKGTHILASFHRVLVLVLVLVLAANYDPIEVALEAQNVCGGEQRALS